MSLVTTGNSFSLAEILGIGSDSATMSLDLFKLISDKSLQIGASLGMLGYFFYAERSIGKSINKSIIPIGSILALDYIGMSSLISNVGGAIGGSYIASKYYLPNFDAITNTDMLYLSGSAILGGIIFDYIYKKFIYNSKNISSTTA